MADPSALDVELDRFVRWLRERPEEAEAVRADRASTLRDERWLRRGERQLDQLLEREATQAALDRIGSDT